MYDQTAQYYDLIYSALKDFEGEVDKIKTLLAREHASAANILDVACGTGEHARYLAQDYVVDGIDLDPQMIEIASEKVSSGEFWVEDMSDFKSITTAKGGGL
jgi:ubiquinone/menaquinone biosynthesis C-methylase UbiE